jgi:flagellin-specific chaperone FliS
MAQMKGLITEARAFHYDHTMPWPGAQAIIMNRLVPKYTEGITKFQNRIEDLLGSLETEWDTMITNAKTTLGPAFDATQYPTIEEVKAACYVRAKFDPVPQPNDFDELQQVEETIKQKIKTQAQHDTTEAFNHAVMTGWDRLRAAITNARDNLAKDPDAGQRFRTEWHGNLTQLLQIMEGLNISNDPELTTLAAECESLLEFSPDALKQSQTRRDRKLNEAEAIVSKLDGIFAGFGGQAKPDGTEGN